MIPEMLTSQPLYPGSSDVDQLFQIVRSIGDLCSRRHQIMRKNPFFSGCKWPKPKEKYALEKRVKPK
ncbi:MAG: Cyclin-dependent kinase-like 2, partial [Paramarteilia canceri]